MFCFMCGNASLCFCMYAMNLLFCKLECDFVGVFLCECGVVILCVIMSLYIFSARATFCCFGLSPFFANTSCGVGIGVFELFLAITPCV